MRFTYVRRRFRKGNRGVETGGEADSEVVNQQEKDVARERLDCSGAELARLEG